MKLLSIILLASFGWHNLVQAEVEPDLAPIVQRWAEIKYNLPEADQQLEYARLLLVVDQWVQRYPLQAEVYIYRGTILSSLAFSQSGLHGLTAANDAKADLEHALQLNAIALHGQAYISLAMLYAQAPSWPIGFGNQKKAVTLLQKALEIDPQGIDANYFYAKFLADKRDYAQAMRYLDRARQAPHRADMPLADLGRQQEISALLARVSRKLI